LLFGSFGLLLAALTALIALGLVRIESFNSHVSALTGAQNRKIGTVSELFLSNGQRAALIDALFGAETVEARAKLQARYRVAMEAYSSAVGALQGLPVAGPEQPARDEALVAAARAQEIGERIVGMLMRGETALASEVNLTQAALAASRLEEPLYLLLEPNHAETAQELAAASQGMRAAFLLIGAGGLLALVAGAVIAVLVIRIVAATEAQLAHEKELAEVTLHSIVDGVIATDTAGLIEYMNPVAEQYLGWKTQQVRGRRLSEVYRLISERDGQPVETLPDSAASEAAEEAMAVRLVDRNGRETPVRYSHAPIRGRDGTVHGMIVVFHDITQLRAMAQQLIWQASHDALTGLVNRREFEHRLAALIETAKEQGHGHALLFMDLDGFKTVNDSCGHSAGDELLRQLTAIMLTRMRGSDTLARLGGDEFGAILESCPMDQALRIANAMRETVREFRFVWEDKTFSVGVSMGLVPITAETRDVSHALALADACCYEAKSKGRDRVQVYRPREREWEANHAELQMVSQISHAFELGRFQLYRQRIISLNPAARGEAHYEVLVRMIDRAGNVVPATGFMPAAERYNLLTSIERWVVSSLVEYLHRQSSGGGAAPEGHAGTERGYYSVNISGVSINDKSFPDFLRNL